MNRKYEAALRALIDIYQSTSLTTVSVTKCPFLLSRQLDFELLEAKGFISLTKDLSTNKILLARLNPSGISYFSDKADRNRDFWKHFFSHFLSGFAVGVLTGLTVAFLVKMLAL